jgi:hypothetical protein
MTNDRAIEIVKNLTQVYICAGIAEFAMLDLDVNFRSPVIHNRIKRIKSDCELIRTEMKRNPVFQEADTDYTDDVVTELSKMVGLTVHFSVEDLREYNNILEQLHKEYKERIAV